MSTGQRPLVLVTGASGSIGIATMACLRNRGADVVTADRAPLPPDGAAVAKAELTVDLTDDSQVERAFGEIPQAGQLQHVIAIAGGGDLEELSQPDPALEPLVPAMGYGAAQIAELEATLRATDADAVLAATPIDLTRVMTLDKPITRVRYDLVQVDGEPLAHLLEPIVLATRTPALVEA